MNKYSFVKKKSALFAKWFRMIRSKGIKMFFVNQRHDDQGDTEVTVNRRNEVNNSGIFNGAIGLGAEYTPMQSWQWDGLLEHVLDAK